MIKRLGFTKVIMLFIAFNAALGVIIGVAFLQTSNKSISDIKTTSMWGVENLKQKSSILKSIALVHSNVLPVLAEKDEESRMIRMDLIGGFIAEVKSNIDKCGTSCEDIRAEFTKYEMEWKNIYDNHIDKSDSAGAMTLVLDKLNPIIEVTFDKLDKKLTETEKQTTSELVAAIARSEKTGQIMVGMVIIFGLLTVAVGIIFQKSVTKILNEISSTLSDNIMMTREIAAKITGGISKLSGATSKQAAAVHETVATVENLSTIVETNARTAIKSHESSEHTTAAATRGKQNVTEMTQVMGTINTNNNEVSQTIEKVNSEFNKIVTVINEIENKTKMINEIVFQTRLLSFNASVEAARAGEAGKGFAVVAEEVGNLAQNSGKAAQEITAMLDSSKKTVNDIVQNNKQSITAIMEKGKVALTQGNHTAALCGESLEEIYTNANMLQDMISIVSESSQKQTSGLKEVQLAMNDLDSATQENTVTAEEFAATATELQVQSDELQKLSEDLNNVISGQKSQSKKQTAESYDDSDTHQYSKVA